MRVAIVKQEGTLGMPFSKDHVGVLRKHNKELDRVHAGQCMYAPTIAPRTSKFQASEIALWIAHASLNQKVPVRAKPLTSLSAQCKVVLADTQPR